MYLLMNKDIKVAEIFRQEVLGVEVFTTGKIFGRLPYGFKNANDWISSRLNHRSCKTTREFVYRPVRTLDTCYCTSIVDTFWVNDKSDAITWSQVSPYRNHVEDVSIDGSYPKYCTRDVLIKWTSWCGVEPYCEALSSELYNIITDGDNIHYDLIDYEGTKATRCELFTDEIQGYVPFKDLNQESGVAGIRYFDTLGDADLFAAMVVADAVCFNEDRHTGNYGILVDNDTLKPLGMAPIFDHNRSMLWRYWGDLNEYLYIHRTALGIDWVRDAQQVLTPHLRSILINLKGYEIPWEGDDKFTKERVDVLNSAINKRIKEVLGRAG